MRRMMAVALMAALLCITSACAVKTVQEDVRKTESAIEYPSQVAESDLAVWEEDALCAVSFLGYRPEAGEQGYVFNTGDEAYYLLPRYTNSTVLIEELDFDGKVLGVLYEGGAEAVAFLCNMSDLRSNCRITVTGNGETTSFSPFISLKDGSLVLPENGRVQNMVADEPTDVEVDDDVVKQEFVGNWSLIVEEEGYDIIYFLALNADGTMSYAYGAMYSEIVAGLTGEFEIVGEGAMAGLPEGTLLFNMRSEYVGYEDDIEAIASFESYSFLGAYEAEKLDNGDLRLVCLSGDELVYMLSGETLVFNPEMY